MNFGDILSMGLNPFGAAQGAAVGAAAGNTQAGADIGGGAMAAGGAAYMGGAPAVGGIATGVGSVIGGMANASSAEQINQEQMAYGREMTAQQEAFQESMSDTSYQRGMADMQKAGLNPMLAFSQGGASAPPGAAMSANLNVPRPGDAFEGVAKGINSALSIASTQADVEKKTADVAQTQATIDNINADTESTNLKNRIFPLEKSIKTSAASSAKAAADTDTAAAQAAINTQKAITDSPYGKYVKPYVDEALSKLGLIMGTTAQGMEIKANVSPFGNLSNAEKDYIRKSRNYRGGN